MNCCTYLLRFDDICPTMNWKVWDIIEKQLDKYNIRPILAVVPDNQDTQLIVNESRKDFWEIVKKWQSNGYSIALHGYQHKRVNNNPGLLRIGHKSEFAGLSREEQKIKLENGIKIFNDNGINVDAWIAPSHSFDQVTVELLAELGITVISDGLSRFPYTDRYGITWVPQQRWKFVEQSSGVCTVCFHHNTWDDSEVAQFKDNLIRYSTQISSLSKVLDKFVGREKTLQDCITAKVEWLRNHCFITLQIKSFLLRSLKK